MSDFLFFEGFQIDCIIGLAEWERMVRQTVSIDLELECDLRRPAATDSVDEQDLNTKALSKRLQAFVSQSQYQLIETLAEAVCELILNEFPVKTVKIRLSKPGAIRGASNVGVVLRRTAEDYPL